MHTLVIIYLIAAFTWWAILLFKKNEEIHQLKLQLTTYENSIDQLTQTEQINASYSKQKKMILGEGAVFGLSILFGLVLINRAYLSELNTNKKLNSFLLSVTHELKTPIAALKMANKTLQRPSLPDATKKQLVQTSLDEALRLEDSVNNILAAAQLEQSYDYNKESNNLSDLVNDRVKRFQKIYPDKELTSTIAANLTAKVDLEAFTKVIDNLLHNAIKYSMDNSPITVALTSEPSQHILTVTNQGPTISSKEKNKIWDKFYRTGNEETRETTGTGLGLWIVKSIVQAHNGTVSLEDPQPSGARFTIKLPLT